MERIKIKYKNKTYTDLYDFIDDVGKDKYMKEKVILEMTFEDLINNVNAVALDKAYDIIDEIKEEIRKKEDENIKKWNLK